MMWKILLAILGAAVAVGSEVMVGGFKDVDISVPGAQDALNFAVAKHNRGTNDMFLSQVAEVTKVQRQVVAGFNFVITVKMAKTSCRKDSPNEVCSIQQDPALARPYQCKFTVWSRPWLNEMDVRREEC